MAEQRLGVDIGGTFTDGVILDAASGRVEIGKVLSTPDDPSLGFVGVAESILARTDCSAAEIAQVVHATTVATNAIIEGTFAEIAFVATAGFRDMLEIGRQVRPSLYDLRFEKPAPLVPRNRCFEIKGRLGARGEELVSVDPEEVRDVARQLRVAGVEAVAVCLLHSYINPQQEREVGRLLSEELPDVSISLSSEIAPEFREYYRASTTVINAAVRPIVDRYLERIEGRLGERGIGCPLLVMQSSGGVYGADAARETPVFMVESGPAAGVVAASHFATLVGRRDVLSFDMGGTTAKAGLILDGTPRITKEYEVGAIASSGAGGLRGGGYPIRTPVIDLVEVGAGGGSIAWVDSGGALRVGPRSAGAAPGPACYGRGGTAPTVTDANVVLGRLNPDYFLGGEIRLDVEAAERAVATCAEHLGLDRVSTASAIVEIANASMINALRLVSVQRGHDPRDLALIAFGGAGPVHANRLAIEMESPLAIVPPSPGIASALGLLITDLKREYSCTVLKPTAQVEPGELAERFAALEAQAGEWLSGERAVERGVAFVRQADVRYVGQSHELTVHVPDGASADGVAELERRFHDAHALAYGYAREAEGTEVVTIRLTAIGPIETPEPARLASGAGAAAAKKAERAVYFAESGRFSDCPIYDRYLLGAGTVVEGPAIVEEIDSTTVVHPGHVAEHDPLGNLLVSRAPNRAVK